MTDPSLFPVVFVRTITLVQWFIIITTERSRSVTSNVDNIDYQGEPVN